MANIDDLKKKAKDALNTIADVSVEAYKIAEEKAKQVARLAKLNTEITREKSLIRRRKTEIGGIYYDLHKDEPEEALKQACDEITEALERIDLKRSEIEDLKSKGAADEDAEGEEDDDGSEDEDDEDVGGAESAPDNEGNGSGAPADAGPGDGDQSGGAY